MLIKRLLAKIILTFVATVLIMPLYAQPAGAEKVMIGGKSYRLYTVAKGDTPYSIIKAFGITADQFNAANPESMGSISVGQKLKIPIVAPSQQNQPQKAAGDETRYVYHSVVRKETIFSITQKYRVSEANLYRYNPDLKSGLKVGMVLKIPKTGEQKQPSGRTHKVEKRETLYAIAKMYNTSQEEILKANPQLKGELKKGTVLTIPEKRVEKPRPRIADIALFEYTVVSGDTFFSLKQRFGVSEDMLRKINENLNEGLKSGLLIYIPLNQQPVMGDTLPKKAEGQTSAAKKSEPLKKSDQKEQFNVALLLPLDASSGDSLRVSAKSASFLAVYQGAMLAVEQFKKSGTNARLFVYDTENSATTVSNIIRKPEFSSMNLVIGPVYTDNQKAISDYCALNQIPMVSPLAPEDSHVSSNPYYFQLNPTKQLRLVTTADYVVKELGRENIIVLARSNGSADSKIVTERIRSKFTHEGKLASNVHFVNIWAEGAGRLAELLKPEVNNVIVMAETNEVNVSIAMNRLNSYAKPNQLTLVGIQDYTRLKSIDVENLHNVNFRYLSPYYIDYSNSGVISFVANYRREYGLEPSQFSFQGYDATTYFLKALDKASRDEMSGTQLTNAGLLQASYDFEKVSENGGFMNRLFFVVEYSNSYDVKTVGKIRGETIQ